MDKTVKRAESKSLSSDDIMKIIKGKANLMTYSKLSEYKNVDDILKPYGACIILYETRKNYGHWVCLFKQNKKTLNFFDSYGLMPDDEIKFIPKYFRDHNNSSYPHLTYLLYTSGYNNIEYNHTQLQKDMRDINTCGRWVAMRLVMRDATNSEFVRFFTKDKKHTPDWLVTQMTMKLV